MMPDWKNTADIVIIGGGILGISTAYYLAEKGQKNVVLLEKDLLAQASTGLCIGGIRQQFSHPSNILLSQESLRLFKNFREIFNADIDFHQDGYLFLANEKETWKNFLTSAEIQLQYKVPVEILSPEEIKYRWPYLEIKDLQGGTFCSEDGFVDPYMVAMALSNSARDHGVRIVEKTKATNIRIKNGRIQGVQTENGNISTPVVVNVAGPWSGEVSRMAGLKSPVNPYRRQVFAVKSPEILPKPVPMIINQDEFFYFCGEKQILLMGKSDRTEPTSFNTNVDWDFLELVIETAVHRAPILETAEILRGWGGLYAITPDENPIIGTITGLEGYYNAIGFSGHGFQHGPAAGRILSDLILDKHTSFDLTPFASDRFKKGLFKGEKRAV